VRRALSLLSLLALAACASSPTANSQLDQEGKQFLHPAPDKGAIYVYRQGLMGMVRPVDVTVAGGAPAKLGHKTYLRVDGPPGPIEVACRAGDGTNARQVEVQPGQTRFVAVSMSAGLLGPGCEVAEVSPDEGRSAVMGARRVQWQ